MFDFVNDGYKGNNLIIKEGLKMKNNGYIAIMHSENYTWIGYGSTEEIAKKSIVKKWNDQGKSCYWMERATVKKLEEYYGIYVIEAINGKCETW